MTPERLAEGFYDAVERAILALAPAVPYTPSYELVRVVREYRPASAATGDASPKPLVPLSLGEQTASFAPDAMTRRFSLARRPADAFLDAKHQEG